jgi:exo-beta-1,3-glucanase (GH17 family)
MRKFIHIITIIFATCITSSCNSISNSDVISVAGRQILLDGTPYLIKGVCYHPVTRGSDQRSFDNLNKDLALMKEANINTIRVYSPIEEKEVLDEILESGLKVIVGFGYNQEGYYDILSGSFIDYIKTYKDHGAILFWELGNEYNYHPEWFGNDIGNWYSALNDAADLVHKVDPSHPVATAHGELPDSLALATCPNIDIWGMNVYRWDNPAGIFSEWAELSLKPMYLSEAGTDSYMVIDSNGYKKGENEKMQADANRIILNEIFNHTDICCGVTLFAFSDEWWKAGNNNSQDPGGWAPYSSGVPYDGAANEEYWGIVDVDRNRKMTYAVIKEKFNEVKK